MRIISVRASLPENRDCWEYRGKMYAYNADATSKFSMNEGHRIPEYIRRKSLIMPVLHPNLKDRTDYYGRKYPPNYHVFTQLDEQ